MSSYSQPMGDLLRIVDRAAQIAGSYGRTRHKPERVDAVTRAAVTVEHVHQELAAFIRFCYQANDNGRLLHVLGDGQLAPGCWTPWRGRSTLTRTQGDLLRRWLLIMADSRLHPPFLYGPDARRWYLDLRRYATVEQALTWLDRHKLTPREWLNLLP